MNKTAGTLMAAVIAGAVVAGYCYQQGEIHRLDRHVDSLDARLYPPLQPIAARTTAVSSAPPLVYVCPNRVAGARTVLCQPDPSNPANTNEVQVDDGYGNPEVTIGRYGGMAVDGDNLSIFPRGDVFHPRIVFSYTTPWGYAAQNHGADTGTCRAPEKWIAATGTWTCTGAGTWQRVGP